jgi:glycosyltransferase involved in cell wall biosynthesis
MPYDSQSAIQNPKSKIQNLAVFTDTYDETNGVATIYRQLVEVAARDPAPPARLGVFCLAEQTGAERRGAATVYRYRPAPRLAVPKYPELTTGLPPRRAVGHDFRAGGFETVLVATPGPLGWLGKRLARQAGRPLVGFYHTRFPAYLAIYAGRVTGGARGQALVEELGFRWLRRLYGECALVICQSAAMEGEARRAGARRTAVWDTGVDLEAFHPGREPGFRRRFGLDPDAPVVLYVGRLAPEKGLEALAELSHRLPELQFLVVGGGPYLETLRRRARATFTGYLRGRDLAEAYRAGDVFFFPSVTDTFGMVLLEALASGVPLVVVDQGPGADLVRRTGGGLTYPAGDLAAAARAVAALAGDPARRAHLAAQAGRQVAQWSWPAAFAQLVALCGSASEAPDGVRPG